jgi:hypothetical protein
MREPYQRIVKGLLKAAPATYHRRWGRNENQAIVQDAAQLADQLTLGFGGKELQLSFCPTALFL